MDDQQFDQVMDLARALDPEDQKRLRALLDVWLKRSYPSSRGLPLTEDEIAEEMLAEGTLDHVPPPMDLRIPRPERPPIHVQGKPLSETIIEERR